MSNQIHQQALEGMYEGIEDGDEEALYHEYQR
jgi:hypothetical protein